MKVIIIFLLIVLAAYNLTPYEYKVQIVEKLGIDSSFIKDTSIEFEKGETVVLTFDENGKTDFSGNINNGKFVGNVDLSYGIGTRCFTKSSNLVGETVFHRVVLKANKTAVINYKKLNETDDLNIYTFKLNSGNNLTPPELTQVYSCFDGILTKENKTIEMKGNTVPSYIYIAIVGGNGSKTGEYEISIEEK